MINYELQGHTYLYSVHTYSRPGVCTSDIPSSKGRCFQERCHEPQQPANLYAHVLMLYVHGMSECINKRQYDSYIYTYICVYLYISSVCYVCTYLYVYLYVVKYVCACMYEWLMHFVTHCSKNVFTQRHNIILFWFGRWKK